MQKISTARTGVGYLTFAARPVAGSATVLCSGHGGVIGPAWADKAVQDVLEKQAIATSNASTLVAVWTAEEALSAKTRDLKRLAAANVLIARAMAEIVDNLPVVPAEGVCASSDLGLAGG